MKSNIKTAKRVRRHRKIRSTISGTTERPRLSVFKSNKYIYAQLINDDENVTLVSGSSREVKEGTMMEKAEAVGKIIADKAKEKNITKIVFDRGGYVFTGRIKALAEGARKAGLVF